ncbi:MAG TPA: DUF2628 domain-containing protein [Acetobacteraceae bacterium]|nr:DUF2628 domain-containing protein [Acetobacteraceae bacterium]
MRFWTAHIRAGAAPVLVREGFSWGALLFGPLWLAVHRAWIAAVLTLAATVLIIVLAPDSAATALLTALILLLGLSGHDLHRWSLDHRGYLLAQVVVAHTELEALGRLLDRRPDLRGGFLPPEAAR